MVSKLCVHPNLPYILLSLSILFKILALVEGAKPLFRISVVIMVGSPRFMKFGLSLRTEFARFTRTLESNSFTISERILFTTTPSMHDEYGFLFWMADP